MESLLTGVADYLLRQSWQIAVVFVFVAVVCWGLRKSNAHGRYWLWLIVLAKCLVPGLILVPLTVLPKKAERPKMPPVIASVSQFVPSDPIAVEPPEAFQEPTPATVPIDTAKSPAMTLVRGPVPNAIAWPAWHWRAWFAAAWLAGVATFVAYALIRAWKTHRWLLKTRRWADDETRAIVAALAERLGLPIRPMAKLRDRLTMFSRSATTRRSTRWSSVPRENVPTVYVVAGIAQPFVWGWLRGSIYLPSQFSASGPHEGRETILAHELAHVARWDAAANVFQIAVQAAFFFHPLVWWTNRQIRREREKCCDEIVIAGLNADPRRYGQAIVNALVAEYEASQPIPSLAVAGRLKNIEERIQTILNPNRTFCRRLSWKAVAAIACLTACIISTGLILTARSGADETTATDSQNPSQLRERNETKASPLTGTVLGLDGKPLADAQVFLATQPFQVRFHRVDDESRKDARRAKTDASGHFSFPPEVDPFYLIVIHDQGRAVIDEAQLARESIFSIEPWTADNDSFYASRRPRIRALQTPSGDATKGLRVRVVDEQGKPVEAADVGTFCSSSGRPDYIIPSEYSWKFSTHAVSDADGMARLADRDGIDCVVARHIERKLVAIEKISPEQVKSQDAVTVTLRPQCKVFGKLTAKELEALDRKQSLTNVYLCTEDGRSRPMMCMSHMADFHFYAPPGVYRLWAYGGDTQSVRKNITVEPGRSELEVEPIDLPPTGFALLQGKPAPELRDVVAWKNGGPVKMSDLRGKAVIVAFGVGWNRPSYLVQNWLYLRTYHDLGAVIIEVRLDLCRGIDSEAKFQDQLAAVKAPYWENRELPIPIALVAPRLPFQAGFTPGCSFMEDYGINGHFPVGILIDREGRVVGEFDPRNEAGVAALAEMFKGR